MSEGTRNMQIASYIWRKLDGSVRIPAGLDVTTKESLINGLTAMHGDKIREILRPHCSPNEVLRDDADIESFVTWLALRQAFGKQGQE